MHLFGDGECGSRIPLVRVTSEVVQVQPVQGTDELVLAGEVRYRSDDAVCYIRGLIKIFVGDCRPTQSKIDSRRFCCVVGRIVGRATNFPFAQVFSMIRSGMPSIVWKGHLTFGLVSIPVKLFRAARKERVRLHYVHRPEPAGPPAIAPMSTGGAEPAKSEPRSSRFEPAPPNAEPETTPPPVPVTRVRQSLVTAGDDQPISRADVLRGYEVEPDQYVTFDREELRTLQRRTSANMEIVRSVRLSEIDPVFFETSYYVVPDRGGEKPYAILFEALKETQHVALARVGMYGREHVVIVRPGEHGILAHTMFYIDEIRYDNEFHANVEGVGTKELELAKTFLEAIEAPFAPEEFKDVYREELQAMIAKKVSEAGVAPTVQQPAATGPVVDILEALKKSIAMARKPPAQETRSARKTAGRVTELKDKKQSRKAR
jgi:DNA end-binding protein Ku